MISPEGCASILWKSAEKAAEAADAMGITADRLKSLGLIDYIVPEPLGGAHRDMEAAAQMLGEAIETNLRELKIMPLDKLMDKRYQRIMSFGQFEE